MRLSEMLKEDNVLIGFKGTQKKDIINELIELADKSGRIRDKEEALRAVMAREEMMSTGLEHGIAIPHAKTDSVSEIVMALGISKQGIDFESVDGEPSKIFFLLLAPETAATANVKLLAQIARVTSSAEFRSRIVSADSPAEVIDIISNAE
ncbi:PTS sugar transporter subunit IIA [candidate division KSB1 bacterium]|nr:MAG: PTS sugar transporter subunit IIA [candidate division KSB1 bacterium]